MLIFLARIPSNSTKQDIANFIGPALTGGLLTPKGTLDSIKIKTIRDRNTNEIEHHAIVKVEPDKVALRVILKLNRTKLKGKPINVRQYRIRNNKNDRRRHSQLIDKYYSRRAGDRRRDSLEIVEHQENIRFQSHRQYSRKLIE